MEQGINELLEEVGRRPQGGDSGLDDSSMKNKVDSTHEEVWKVPPSSFLGHSS